LPGFLNFVPVAIPIYRCTLLVVILALTLMHCARYKNVEEENNFLLKQLCHHVDDNTTGKRMNYIDLTNRYRRVRIKQEPGTDYKPEIIELD
tara:strand:+ start:367 stop:642 length:276 start_codon:yes stop_codon:yes gene_type:complete